MGEKTKEALRLQFDKRLRLEFRMAEERMDGMSWVICKGLKRLVTRCEGYIMTTWKMGPLAYSIGPHGLSIFGCDIHI
jgi:hypothetical protein